jgi:hypothetical protein
MTQRQRFWVRQAACWLGLWFLCGCDGPVGAVQPAPASRLDTVKIQELIAVYMGKTLHKTLYVNVVPPGGDWQKTFSNSSWGLPDVQAAIDEGERACRNYAGSKQTDPNRCVPVYIDEQKVLDWSIYQ